MIENQKKVSVNGCYSEIRDRQEDASIPTQDNLCGTTVIVQSIPKNKDRKLSKVFNTKYPKEINTTKYWYGSGD